MSEYRPLYPREDGCSGGVFARPVPLAMAYVRLQAWERPYGPQKALASGTAFPSLEKPFEAMEVTRSESC